jgi:hypothetical protein
MRGIRSFGRSPYCFGLVYFAVITVLMTWPLATRLADTTVSRPGDNLYWIWQIGWFEKALFSLHQSPLVTNLLNYPEGWSLASTEISPLTVLLALPFSIAVSPTLGYNVAALVSFAMSGLLLFVWVFRLTGNVWGALIGGTIFAFFPFRLSHFLAGHLNLLATPAVIAAFMCLDQALHQEDRPRRWAAAGGVSLGLVGLSSMYYLYMSLVMMVCYFALDLVLGARQRPPMRAHSSRLAVFGAASLPILLLALLPYLSAASKGLVPTRGIEAAVSYSGSPSDYLLPFTGHPLWGQWVGDHFNRSGWIEASLYAGVVASVLALLGWVAPSRASPVTRARALTFAISSAVAFVLSLGVTLHWAGWPVSLPLPAALGWLNAEDGTSILMPGYLLYKVLPLYGSLRVPMRYAVYVELFLSVLAGCGAASLLSKVKHGAAPFLGAALLALVLLDFLPPRWTLTPVAGRPVDLWLRQQPPDGAVAQFPFILADEQSLLYATLIHEKPYIGALYGSFPTAQFRAVKPILDEFPSPASLDLLRDLGVRYVVIEMKWYDDLDYLDDVELALAAAGLERAAEIDGQLVYLLDG